MGDESPDKAELGTRKPSRKPSSDQGTSIMLITIKVSKTSPNHRQYRGNIDLKAGMTSSPSITRRLYLSHFLSTWNSRTFEFGAVLFLATIFPGTLFYASIYALVRAASATLFSARVGRYIDVTNRLVSIRHSIILQRCAVGISCGLFLLLIRFPVAPEVGNGEASARIVVVFWIAFPLAIALACVEKLASIGNTVAIERDWVVVICDAVPELERGDVNAVMRRIDLFCKLIAPVVISFVDAFDTRVALWTVLGMSATSMGIEYLAIVKVYEGVPALGESSTSPSVSSPGGDTEVMEPGMGERESTTSLQHETKTIKASITAALEPWINYIHASAFLASLSLCILYLTVLSTGPQWQTYLLATGYTSISISLLRFLAVISELLATLFAPMLMHRIGPIRSGLWSINWQVVWLTAGVLAFLWYDGGWWAGAGVTLGIVVSRLGLWGFDLSVQFIVQDSTPPSQRNTFSSSEIALQNAFELLSFLSTIVFPQPSQFKLPVLISLGAVVAAAACFAGYVRKERGHLIHVGDCVKFAKGRDKLNYRILDDGDLEEREE